MRKIATRAVLLILVSPLVLVLGIGGGWLAWRALAEIRHELGSDSVGQLSSGPQATLIYDAEGKLTHSLFMEQRIDVPLAQVSPSVIQAVLAAEDQRFYKHYGIDPIRVAGAAVANFNAGRITEGGSTITQQLARNLGLSRERTWTRKVREVLAAAELEARHDKDTILETYLNTAYFGEGYYGVEAAARGYFGKHASSLEAGEAAMLAGLIRAPSANSPNRNPDGAVIVRNLVLRQMRDTGAIDDAEMRRSVASPISVRPRRSNGLTAHNHDDATACGGYYFEEVRKQLVTMFGEDQVLEGGLRVHTTYSPDVQLAAERSVKSRLAQLNRASLQGALVAMEPKTGHVLALVGGRDFHASSYNRATQAHRQPGSAFKPFIFAAAIERGWAPGTKLTSLDAPIGDGTWMPGGDHEASSYTLRRALTVSSNRAAAQLMQQVGMSSTLHTARRMGIESDLPAVPSLALGTGEVTLLEMVASYGVFANEGVWTRPTMITRVENAEGEEIWTAPFDQRRALSTGGAYLMNSMLADVVNRGTGYRARQMGFTLPAAGKTGTTDDYADAWFVGYTPGVVAGVWFGYDERRTIVRGAHASDIAVPAWASFMRVATRGDAPVWYEMPSDVEKVEICGASGHRAGESCRRSPGYSRVLLMDGTYENRPVQGGITTELFTLGNAPYGECPVHSGLNLDTSYVYSDPAMPEYPEHVAADAGASPLYTAASAVEGETVESRPVLTPVMSAPTVSTTEAPMPIARPSQPAAPAGADALYAPARPVQPRPSLGTLPKATKPAGVPGTPVRSVDGMKIERVARPDGTIVTIIKNRN